MKAKKVYTIVVILMISCFFIVTNFGRALRNRQYLEIDNSNRKQVEELIGEKYLRRGNLVKIGEQQMLGDWTLYLSYDNSTEDDILFKDGEKMELRDYIKENGYADGMISGIIICISLIAILGVIIYILVIGILKAMDMIKGRKQKVPQ